jgi:hypothetical protein
LPIASKITKAKGKPLLDFTNNCQFTPTLARIFFWLAHGKNKMYKPSISIGFLKFYLTCNKSLSLSN